MDEYDLPPDELDGLDRSRKTLGRSIEFAVIGLVIGVMLAVLRYCA
jgi:hypothetical protein